MVSNLAANRVLNYIKAIVWRGTLRVALRIYE